MITPQDVSHQKPLKLYTLMLAINATGNPYVFCSTHVPQCVQRQVHACAAAHW
jgi:hypothetical protein